MEGVGWRSFFKRKHKFRARRVWAGLGKKLVNSLLFLAEEGESLQTRGIRLLSIGANNYIELDRIACLHKFLLQIVSIPGKNLADNWKEIKLSR